VRRPKTKAPRLVTECRGASYSVRGSNPPRQLRRSPCLLDPPHITVVESVRKYHHNGFKSPIRTDLNSTQDRWIGVRTVPIWSAVEPPRGVPRSHESVLGIDARGCATPSRRATMTCAAS
jgi:hypothetical protein